MVFKKMLSCIKESISFLATEYLQVFYCLFFKVLLLTVVVVIFCLF